MFIVVYWFRPFSRFAPRRKRKAECTLWYSVKNVRRVLAGADKSAHVAIPKTPPSYPLAGPIVASMFCQAAKMVSSVSGKAKELNLL